MGTCYRTCQTATYERNRNVDDRQLVANLQYLYGFYTIQGSVNCPDEHQRHISAIRDPHNQVADDWCEAFVYCHESIGVGLGYI